MQLTALERSLLQWFKEHAPEPALSAQLDAATPSHRKYTGAGLFLDLAVPDSALRVDPAVPSPVRGPEISSSVRRHGAGSLLFLENGTVSTLEVFTYEEELSSELPDFALSASGV